MDQGSSGDVFRVLGKLGGIEKPVIYVSTPPDILGQQFGRPTHLRYTSFYMPSLEHINGTPLTLLATKGVTFPDLVELFELPFAQFDRYVRQYRSLAYEYLGIPFETSESKHEFSETAAIVEEQFPKAVEELPPRFRIGKNVHGRIPAVQNCRSRLSPFKCHSGGDEPACSIFHRRVNTDIRWDRREAEMLKYQGGRELNWICRAHR